MRTSAILRLGACIAVALAMVSRAPGQEDDEGNNSAGEARHSTWEPSTSLTFQHYFEPFTRVASARACRDRCVYDPRCTGWTYYDPNFREAGELSYQLQRVCVLGSGLRDRKFGTRPGRTSGIVRADGPPDPYNAGDYRPRRDGNRPRSGDQD